MSVVPLLSRQFTARLRETMQTNFTSAAVAQELGPVGQSALARADSDGVERVTDSGLPTATLIRLFLLGLGVDVAAATAAMGPVSLTDAIEQGLLTLDVTDEGEQVRAAVDVRPYAESGNPDWWVVSDLASDVRPGPVQADHVLGIGTAGTTLAQAVIRARADRALDLGTGCGLQSLHLSRHCRTVVATDVNSRALAIAATNARLNELDWDLRQGSLFEPVQSENFDLVVCNPPFIVGPGFELGNGGYHYRDSGMAGDAVSQRLIRGLPALLSDGGTGQLLANWAVTAQQSWQERVEGWLVGSGCDAWIWQRELVEPGEYVSQWLRDSGELPASQRWRAQYQTWMDWFDRAGVLAVGMGLVSLRRSGSEIGTVIAEDIRQVVQQPAGPTIDRWLRHARWLREHDDDQLLAAVLTAAPDLVLSAYSTASDTGWVSALTQIQQGSGARWQLETDAGVSALVAGCRGQLPVGWLLSLLQASGHDVERSEAAETVRDLIRRDIVSPFPE